MKLSKVVAAAIMLDGVVYSLPRPARHPNIIHFMVETHGLPTPIVGEQGFVLEDGRFVRRKSAGLMAIRTGQINSLRWPPRLYSEDLW